MKSQPEMVANAKLLPVIQGCAKALLSLVPDQNPKRPTPRPPLRAVPGGAGSSAKAERREEDG